MAISSCWISFGLLFVLLMQQCDASSVISHVLCSEWTHSADVVTITMDTTPIAGTNGFCSCRMSFNATVRLSMFFNEVMSPNCDTDIKLVDNSYVFICQNNFIVNRRNGAKDVSLINTVRARDELWMIITTTNTSTESMSGTAQFKINSETEFTFACFAPNTNSSVTRGSAAAAATTTTIATTTPSEAEASTHDESTEPSPSNENLRDDRENDFPVVLTAGAASGGVVLIGVIVLVVVCCRKKKKPPEVKDEKRYTDDDEFLQMENVLYCSSGDLTDGPQLYSKDLPKDPGGYSIPTTTIAAREDALDMVEKDHRSAATNGDMYTLVNKSGKNQDTQIDHTTAPSGDVYTVISKVK